MPYTFNGIEYKDYAEFMDAMNPEQSKRQLPADGYIFEDTATQPEIHLALMELGYEKDKAGDMAEDYILARNKFDQNAS